MKLTTEKLKELIKEEIEKLDENPLEGATAAPEGKEEARKRKIASLKSQYEIRIKDMKKKYPKEKHKELEALLKSGLEDEIKKLDQAAAFGGDTKTAARAADSVPSDLKDPFSGPTASPDNNPFGGKNETVSPDNPKGEPIGKRVTELEKVVKELIRFIQKGNK